jgi:hypothetical protein
MTKNELGQAMDMVRKHESTGFEDIGIFDGFGLSDFKPVTVTVSMVAQLVRWQALRFDGSIDADALQEIANCGRHKFIVV